MLVFKSTIPETVSILEEQGDGRRRVALATKSDGWAKNWQLVVNHPSGRTWWGISNGPRRDVIPALAEMLGKTENEYRTDKARGDRPWTDPPDRSRAIGIDESPIPGTNRR